MLLSVSDPLGQPLRRSGVFGAVRRQRRSGAAGAGGRAGLTAALFFLWVSWYPHTLAIELQDDGVVD